MFVFGKGDRGTQTAHIKKGDGTPPESARGNAQRVREDGDLDFLLTKYHITAMYSRISSVKKYKIKKFGGAAKQRGTFLCNILH